MSVAGYVLVAAAGERVAVPVEDVAEVLPPMPVTEVPGMPAWLRGLASWRGRMLAVADLPLLLGAAEPVAGPVLVVRRDGLELGLVCEEALGTLDEQPGPLTPLAATVSAAGAAVLRGTLQDGDDVVSVLDVRAVMALRDALPAREGLQPGA